MNLFLLLLTYLFCYCLAGDIPAPTRIYNYNQKIDHFSNSYLSRTTFPQRVFEFNKFWKTGNGSDVGPLFVYTGYSKFYIYNIIKL